MAGHSRSPQDPGTERTQVAQTIAEREAQYAGAWEVTGKLVASPLLMHSVGNLLNLFPDAWFPWVMILNKLIRALWSPKNPDHWLDIQGYAKLVHDRLTEKEI